MWVGACVSVWGAGSAAWFFVLVAPVGFLGLDLVAAEDLAGGEVGDGDVVVVGEREDAFAGVGCAEMVGALTCPKAAAVAKTSNASKAIFIGF